MSTTVLVSGASGFIALHTVQELIRRGYNVVGSVRSAEKGEYVKNASGNPDKFSYEIVEDISKKGAFDNFVEKYPEASAFLHTASPFHFNISDIETDFLIPAVNGTKGALASIKKYGKNIKRVVITSSYAAIASIEADGNPEITIDESSWNDATWESSKESAVHGYRGSKALAEKAAWDFVEQEKPGFILSTVNPVFVFGPQPTNKFDTSVLNTSSQIINRLLKLPSPDAEFRLVNDLAVDVRDVAKAHIVAFEKNEAKNERLFLTAGRFTQQTILDVLHAEFPEATEKVPVGTPGSASKDIQTRAKFSNEKTKKILDFELISIEQSVIDSVKQILEVEAAGSA